MHASEKLSFCKELEKLGKLYSKKIDKDIVEFYWMPLIKYSLESVTRAFSIIGETHKHFPKPIEVKEFIKSTQKGTQSPIRHNAALEREYWVLDKGYVKALGEKDIDAMKRFSASMGMLQVEMGYVPVKSNEVISMNAENRSALKSFIQSYRR